MHFLNSTTGVCASDRSHLNIPFEGDTLRSRSDCRTAAPNVLCYGHDRMLSQSRKCLLQLAGCLSDTVTNEVQFEFELLESAPGVIVLCQTLLPEECRHACTFALEHAPESRLLLLIIRTQKCFPVQHYTLLHSTAGPKVFSATVFDLLYRERFGPNDLLE